MLGGKDVGADLPAVHMTDIGKDDGGATPEQVAAVLLESLTDSVLDVIKDQGLDDLEGKAKGLLDKAGDAIKGVFGK